MRGLLIFLVCAFMECRGEVSLVSFLEEDIPRLKRADEFLEAGLYDRAIASYQEALAEENSAPQVKFRLALAYMNTHEYEKVIGLLKENKEGNAPYLLALAYKEQKKYSLAKQALEQYLANPSSFAEEARLELGIVEFLSGQYQESRKQLEQVTVERLHPFVAIYLARLNLVEGNPDEAIKKLKEVSAKGALDYEVSYLLGEAYFQQHHYSEAIVHFTSVLQEKSEWYIDALYYLGWSYLKNGELDRAEESFKKMVSINPQEKGYLALARCYAGSPEKIEAVLSPPGRIHSPEGKAQALLLRAEAAKSYEERDVLYRALTEDSSKFLYMAYMRGLNDFDYAEMLQLSGNEVGAEKGYRRAAEAFALASKDPLLEADALKYQALAVSHWDKKQALMILNRVGTVQDRGEILYLWGYFAGSIDFPLAVTSLRGAAAEKGSRFSDIALHHLGGLYYQRGEYEDAEGVYLELVSAYPSSPLAAESLYWTACCADKLNREKDVGKKRRQQVFDQYPSSPYAPEAYFTVYSYQDYLQGDKSAMKHLEGFQEKFNETPFLIEAYYLIGLDYKRDRKTSEGRWIRKKSLTDAIDAFQQVEILFDVFEDKKLIPKDKFDYYAAMRYRAILERAMGNLAIAEEAQGAKRQIYIDYSEEVFNTLLKELSHEEHLLAIGGFSSIIDESTFGLARTYIESGRDLKADELLAQLLGRNPKRYYEARAWDEKGRISMRQGRFQEALDRFKKAEEIAGRDVLTTDQRLDLLMQQSLCCREMKRFDDAILVLSRVVNDDAVSTLRLKAMYLRAETYEIQGRLELAKKQL
ncbi:MAG: tetratricopeptide repeat protein, partial [Parachlamydiaceae bacterium]